MINLKKVQQKVKYTLDKLVDSGVLGSVIVDEGALDLAVVDIPKDPCAVLFPPAIETVLFDTSTENSFVLRFEIPVIRIPENTIENYSTIDLMDNIISAFDADPTLKGDDNQGVVLDQAQPATVEHFTVSSPGKTMVIFMLTLKYTVLGTWR